MSGPVEQASLNSGTQSTDHGRGLTKSGSSWLRRGIALAVVVVGCLAAYGLSIVSRETGETVGLWVPPDALNIGTVWETDRFEWTLPVENREGTLLEVDHWSTTCNCLSVEPQSFVLEPGARRELRLRIDLGSQLKSTGEVSIQLLPRLKESSQVKKLLPQWTITGRVQKVLVFDRQVYLGRHSELSQPLGLKTIPIKVLVPLESLAADCDVPGLKAVVEGRDQGKAEVRLSPLSTLPTGDFKGTVSLKPVLQGGERLPTQRIQSSGKIVPDVECAPPAVQVGGRRIGETFEDAVVLRSLTGSAFATLGANVEGDGLTVEPLEGSKGFRVRQEVRKVGSQSNRILFNVHSGGREVAITLPVSYTGFELR